MQVLITEEVRKHYQHLPKAERIKIRKRLSVLEGNPFAGKKLEGEIAKYRSLKAWPYRIIYSINEKQKIIIVKSILHRQGAYK